MARIESILAVVDLKRSTRNAVLRAARLAAEHAARLTLLHVVDPADSTDPLRQRRQAPSDVDLAHADACAGLERWIAEVARQRHVVARAEVPVGAVLREVFDAAQAADLVVIGARTANPLREVILGAPAEQMLRTLRRPVLIVRRAPTQCYLRALVAVNFGPCSAPALRLAASFARRGVVHVLRALDVPADDNGQKTARLGEHITGARHAARRMRALAAGSTLPAGGHVFEVGQGDVAELIRSEARRIEADLVVVGKDGRMPVASYLLGRVARRALCGARCDTLVVPPSSAAASVERVAAADLLARSRCLAGEVRREILEEALP
jgi:nucleotide-binding universal stress UspA family protein